MDWQDVTTEQILQELVNRYHHFGFVGSPKDKSAPQWLLVGQKHKVDELMAAFIANQTTVSFVGTPGAFQFLDKPAPVLHGSVEDQIAPLLMASSRLFSELIFCGIARNTPASEKPHLCVAPDVRTATEIQRENFLKMRAFLGKLRFPWEQRA
jgi:hypothetical protein